MEHHFTGGCHCGKVRFAVRIAHLRALECNCSICARKGYLHVIVERDKFDLLAGRDNLTTYTFHTHVARHHFCSTCGIHSFYEPRSHPGCIDVNARCLDGDILGQFTISPFDGRNWEQAMSSLLSRRELLAMTAGVATAALTGSALAEASSGALSSPRVLGKRGVSVGSVSLGGEGILRSTGRSREAIPVILEALRLGVRYCDTAPAYQQSQDYYGEAFRAAGSKSREKVFLASKTHARSRDGALALLEDSLRRLGTDHLDLWQLHDLRDQEDLVGIFGPDGALKAAQEAQRDGRVRFIGLTGHHDPAILLEAMRRFPFDSVLCAINPADPARLPFITSVVAEARRRGMGVVGMKVMAAGRLLAEKRATTEELLRYAASLADTVIVGCSSIEEVRENLRIGKNLRPMSSEERVALEKRIAPSAARYDWFKRPS